MAQFDSMTEKIISSGRGTLTNKWKKQFYA